MGIFLKIVAALMLFVALGKHPYGYYIVLRWVVCGVSIFSAIEAGGKDKTAWAWSFAATAVLFNPILPIHLSRSIWTPIDLIVAIIFLVSIGAVSWTHR